MGCGDGKIARKVEFVPPAYGDPVQPGDRGLAAPKERFHCPLEESHVLPVVTGPLRVPGRILSDISSGAERVGPRAGQHDDADRVIERRVLDGPRELLERSRCVGVVNLRTIEGDSRDAPPLFVEEVVERGFSGTHRAEHVPGRVRRVRAWAHFRHSGPRVGETIRG